MALAGQCRVLLFAIAIIPLTSCFRSFSRAKLLFRPSFCTAPQSPFQFKRPPRSSSDGLFVVASFTLLHGCEHGHERRKTVAPDQRFIDHAPALTPGQLLDPLDKVVDSLSFEHGFLNREGHGQIFWTAIMPRDRSKIENVVVFHHGLNDHTGWAVQHAQMAHAALFNSATVSLDMPGWGRSDGLFMHIPRGDWFEWVSHAAAFVEEVVHPMRSVWEEETGRKLKMFGHGESMGGAICLSLVLKQAYIYDGIVLSAPAVNGAKEVMPHPAVVWLLRTFIMPLIPTLPQAPFDDVTEKCHEHSEQVLAARRNPFSPMGRKLRFSTAGALVQAVEYISEHLDHVSTPFLVFHSNQDTVTSPESSQRLYDRASSTDKTIQLWEVRGGDG